jgi:hypothetical protein
MRNGRIEQKGGYGTNPFLKASNRARRPVPNAPRRLVDLPPGLFRPMVHDEHYRALSFAGRGWLSKYRHETVRPLDPIASKVPDLRQF